MLALINGVYRNVVRVRLYLMMPMGILMSLSLNLGEPASNTSTELS